MSISEPLHRTKRIVYVVLLCVAILASGAALYNQLSSDSTSNSLADQVAQACSQNHSLALAQGLNCGQANDVKQNGAAVINGPKGDKGDKGDRGDDGTSIQGPPGAEGKQGIPGESIKGDKGADSTVVGPAGSNGKDGKDGKDGVNGTNGVNGANGMPAASWQWTDPSGVTYTCTRNNTDDTAPTYVCN